MSPHSISLVALLKGVVYDSQKQVWDNLIEYENDIRKHFLPFGVELYVDKTEHFAFLKQKEFSPETEMPRLIERRHLSFPLTLALLTVRKFLLEKDTAQTTSRPIITKQQIVDRLKPYFPDSNNEAKQVTRIEAQITRLVEEGFLRPFDEETDTYEVRPIIKAFVDADKVDEILEKLMSYSKQVAP